jgi:putative nucleotidyltransferase with HDIG domain
MITLEQITSRIKELAPLPPTATRLAALLASPNYSVNECVEVVRYDQILTLAIFKYANSAFSASTRPITDMKEAVVRLGGGRILRELLATHLRQSLATPLPAYGYSENELWRHSVAAVTAVEILGKRITLPAQGLVFTAALLHDVGKLVLARTAPRDDMEIIWQTVTTTQCSCETAEKTVLGLSHAEVGAEVIASWGLPEVISSAVRNHHATSDTGDNMTDCVMVANMIARVIGEGIGNEGMNMGGDANAGKRLGLTRDKFELTCAESQYRMQEVMAAFGAKAS